MTKEKEKINCEHKYYIEPSKQDMNKIIFTNTEFNRLVLRCYKCGQEIKCKLGKPKMV